MKPIDKKPLTGKHGRPEGMPSGLTGIERQYAARDEADTRLARKRLAEINTGNVKLVPLAVVKADIKKGGDANTNRANSIQPRPTDPNNAMPRQLTEAGGAPPSYAGRDPEARKAYMREKMRARRAAKNVAPK